LSRLHLLQRRRGAAGAGGTSGAARSGAASLAAGKPGAAATVARGIALQLLAFGLQTGALLLAPLTAVQPADAAGLLLLLYLGSRHLGEGIGRAEVIAVVSILTGIVGLAIAAPRRQVTSFDAPDIFDVWLPVAALALAALAPYLLRNWRDAGSRLVILGAGFAFALSAFCAKLLADSLARHAWGAARRGGRDRCAWWRDRHAQRAVRAAAAPGDAGRPLVFVIELLVPVGLAVTVIGENWSNSRAWIGVCLVLVTVGTVALARTPTIAQLIASGHAEAPAVR